MNKVIFTENVETKITQLYSSAFAGSHAPKELYRKVTNDPFAYSETRKPNPHYHRIPKIAAVAIMLTCILALGGVSVLAMTGNFTFRDFFFRDSVQEYENIYSNAHKELVLNNYKIVYEGSIYDKAAELICLNFSVWDKHGQPVELEGKLEKLPCNDPYDLYPNLYFDATFTGLTPFRLADEVWGIVTSNVSGNMVLIDGNGLFISLSRLSLDSFDFAFTEKPEYADFQFVLLNTDEIKSLKTEIMELDKNGFCPDVPELKNPAEIYHDIDYGLAQSTVSGLLEKYDPIHVDFIDSPSQVIQVENLKLTVGRISMIMEYNASDCTVTEFTMIREDGTRTRFWRENPEGQANKFGGIWIVDGVNENRLEVGSGNLNADFKVSYNYGFILGNDEKVKIEANGITYE